MDGWYGRYGRNTNRLWLKSEEKSNTAFKSGYNMDMQVLYGRLIAKYYDFQVGVRVENQTSKGGEETARAHFVIGLHELATDRYEVESALFISQDGDVSARFKPRCPQQIARSFHLKSFVLLLAHGHPQPRGEQMDSFRLLRFETEISVER